MKGIESRAGCFLVDYSFVELEAIKPGYTRNSQVYDVNKDKSIKEWIYVEQLSPTRFWLQHVLFGEKLDGSLMEGSVLKHTGEDWIYDSPYLYDYAGALTWKVRKLPAGENQWTRRITNLDDGLRYQCAAAWKMGTGYPDWSCADAAPIPGRETRDMHRKDYNELDRGSRIIVYDQNWLEREANTKISAENGVRTPLVKELGKTWYVRLPDDECKVAQDFVVPRKAFWGIVRQAWDDVLNGQATLKEAAVVKGMPSRYEQILDLEQKYSGKNLSDAATAKEAKDAVLKVIQGSVTPVQ